MDGDSRLDALRAEIRAEFPGFRLVPKQASPLSRVLGAVLSALTLGRQRAYMASVVTTIGRAVYVPSDWAGRSADQQYLTLRHERIHLRQFRRFGLLPMVLGYLLVPLPMGLAWVRARLEWAAYAEGLRAGRELYGPAHLADPAVRAHVVGCFTGPAYGWMWPFRRQIESWIEDEMGN